jgi:hypothetical protein
MKQYRGVFKSNDGSTYDLGLFFVKAESKAWVRAYQLLPRDGEGRIPEGKILFV